MPPLNLLIKPASGRCNMRCRYCFYADETSHREVCDYGMMPEDVLEIMIKKALVYADGSCTFGFQGGEPTLRGLDFFRRAVELQKKTQCEGRAYRKRIADEWLAAERGVGTLFS